MTMDVITEDVLRILGDFPRLEADPDHVGGHVRVRGTRIPAAVIVELVASGQTLSQILEDFPALVAEDIHEALRFASELVHGVTVR
jgi:uncharacterized protein (DUF433 family)